MGKKTEEKRPELAVGSLVTLDDYKASTGGLIYKIVERSEPKEPAFTVIERDVKIWLHNPGKMWEPKTAENGVWTIAKRKEHGYFNEKKKKMPNYKVHGYVRMRPVYEFYPTSRGSNPKGKGDTILVNMRDYTFQRIKPVALTDLAKKHFELGKVIQDFITLKSASHGDDAVSSVEDDASDQDG